MELLCRHLDNELDAPRQTAVAEHLNTCQTCTERLRALQGQDTLLARMVPGRHATVMQRPDCYSPEALSAYASDQLTPREAERCESHLYTCDFCLQEVMAIRRTLALLRREELLTPSHSLVANARQAFAASQQASNVQKLGALVIQVATDGLTFIEALLLPENVRLAIGGHMVPATAFRSEPARTEAVALLDMRQSVHDLDFHCRALHEEGETVLLQIRIQKEGEPLVRRRVSLYSHGRTLYSKLTSAGGEVEFPRLTPGDYTIQVPREKIETRVVLRAASETPDTG